MKIARLLPLLLVFGIFASASCQSLKRDQKQAVTAQDDTKLLGRWMRSHEEDKGAQPHIWRNVKTFTFPPARGREGIVFLPDAKCIYLAIAPADGTDEQPGTYGWGGPHHLKITLENGTLMTLNVKELSADKLVANQE